MSPFCDTSVLIRLITGDDTVKQERAIALFERVEQGALTLTAPDTVIADAVFVLASKRLYQIPRSEVAARLASLVRLPHFQVKNRQAVLRALQRFGASTRLDFGDALILALMEQRREETVFAYDRDFDGIPGIVRREPE